MKAAFQADYLINVGHLMIAFVVPDGHVEQRSVVNTVVRESNPIIEIIGNDGVPGFV